MADVTRLLDAAAGGDKRAAADLLPVVYEELRRLAAARLSRERAGQTLNATGLVHEAYLRLVGEGPGAPRPVWDGRGHFFAAAAEAMRRILVDLARRKQTVKHGGECQRIELTDAAAPAPDTDLIALDEALTRLAEEDPIAARVVELRHFAGLTADEAAEALGTTKYAVQQKWSSARAWLKVALGE